MATPLKTLITFWLPPSVDEYGPEFDRALVLSNLTRLRMVAWVLMVFVPLVTILDLQIVAGLPGVDARQMYLQVLEVRGLLVMGPALFLAIVRLPASAEGVTTRHRIAETSFILFCTIIASVVAGLGQQVRPSIGAYLLTVFVASAFLGLNLPKMLLAYLPSLMAMVVLVLRFQPDPSLVAADLVNGVFMTFLALIVSRVQYVTRAREFMDQRLIEGQRRELERANGRLAETNEILRRLSYLDALIDIPNRRYFDEYLEREWTRAAREHTSLSLVMVDLDHFKRFNDSYGHQMGDQVLIRVALALRESLKRPADFLARYGGEEFVVVLPATDLEGAQRVSDRMRRRVAAIECYPFVGGSGVTVSLGAASCRPGSNAMSRGELLAAADRALYRAKAAGRNQCSWEPCLPLSTAAAARESRPGEG